MTISAIHGHSTKQVIIYTWSHQTPPLEKDVQSINVLCYEMIYLNLWKSIVLLKNLKPIVKNISFQFVDNYDWLLYTYVFPYILKSGKSN